MRVIIADSWRIECGVEDVMLIRMVLLAGLAMGQTPARQTFFQSPYSPEEMRGKQAVLETSAGTIVIDLLADAAPNHVGLFMKLARDGAYAGTTFHWAVAYGAIQGGDPLSRDPAKRAAYGSGGFNQLRLEPNREKHDVGAVSGVQVPGRFDSAGAQFFIVLTDQPAFDGQQTVFGRVSDGLEVAQQISALPTDGESRLMSRVEITRVTIRDTPPEPFFSDTPADLAAYRVVLETTMGAIVLEMWPDKAPATVRQFLRMADAGVYDGVTVHRVVPNFVVQTGAMNVRAAPLTVRQQRLVGSLPPEFTNTPNVSGVVSMARGDAPDSGSTSFFICSGDCRSLDGKYTAFARVADGVDALTSIATVPVDGETPRTPIVVTRARVEKRTGTTP
jgi:cyclophilin family peptidyl-prolyl cis-trans isomerase